MYTVVYVCEKNISDGPSGRSWCRYRTEIIFSKAMCTGLSRQLLIPRIELSALSVPYRARHGTATGFPAPTTGTRGDAHGPASARPSGAATAAPPAGAQFGRGRIAICEQHTTARCSMTWTPLSSRPNYRGHTSWICGPYFSGRNSCMYKLLRTPLRVARSVQVCSVATMSMGTTRDWILCILAQFH
jgi:hypothetical protein